MPSHPLSQMDGTFQTDSGSVDSMRANVGSSYKTGVQTLINDVASPLTQRIVLLTGRLDGDGANGRVTYLGGHDYSLDLPITSNPQTNGVRLFLNTIFESDCATTLVQDDVVLTQLGPAVTGTSEITYTISYTNPGSRPVENVVLTNVLPNGASFVSATGGGTDTSGVVTWNLPPLAAGGSGSVGLTVSVADGTYADRTTMNFSHLTERHLTSNTVTTLSDTTPPVVEIDETNPAVTSDVTPTLTFYWAEASNYTSQCTVYEAAPPNVVVTQGPCTLSSPTEGSLTVPDALDDGESYIFEASIVDVANHIGVHGFVFTIDATSPIVEIPEPPVNPTVTNDATPSFAFLVSGESGPTSTVCRISPSGGPAALYQPCLSSFASPAPLAEGDYVFEVRATDFANNVADDQFPFTIDTAAPLVAITSGPSGATGDVTPTFTFSVTDASPTTTQCRFDGNSFVACSLQFSSPTPLSDNNVHVLEVVATDEAGNVGTATQGFFVDSSIRPTPSSARRRRIRATMDADVHVQRRRRRDVPVPDRYGAVRGVHRAVHGIRLPRRPAHVPGPGHQRPLERRPDARASRVDRRHRSAGRHHHRTDRDVHASYVHPRRR